MRVETFLKFKPQITKDYIAYEWIRLKKAGDFYIPDSYYLHKDLEPGKACIGKAIAVGPDAKLVKPGDLFIFGEYGADSGAYLEEDHVYFQHEYEIETMIDKIPVSLISPKVSEDSYT